MKVNREDNVLVYSGKSCDLNEVLETLSLKDSKTVSNFLVEKTSLPRELRTNALRLVLNEYVKIAKELVLSDEFMYRLNWYQKFSEFQLVNFWNVLVTKNSDKFDEGVEVLKYKKTFYLLLLLNADKVGFSDKELEQLLALKTPDGEDESFQEFMSESDDAFYDYEYNFDGMSYEDFKTNLKRCATVADIRNIAEKYDIKVPKRLKKEELVAVVAEGLRRQGKYDETTEAQLKKMSAITLQRFAKMNGINASTEMKKADVVDYIMNHIEASTKAVRKPRIELVTIKELTDFEFSKDYLRDVNIVDEEEIEEVVEQVPVVEEAPVEELVVAEEIEETPAQEEIVEVVEETIEEAPAQEEIEEVVEETIEEASTQEEIEEVVEEPVEEDFEEETYIEEIIEEEPEYEEILIDEDEVINEYVDEDEEPVSIYNDELLERIIKLLEDKERRDVVNDVLEDNRFNSMVKLYEERIAYLEKMIHDMRSTPIPINIQLTYPNAPVVQEVSVLAEEEPAVEETPVEEVVEESTEEILPECTEEVAEKVVEGVTPITLDSTFDGLTDEEKAAVAKEEMKDADKVSFDPEVEPTTKREKKAAKKLKKYEKKRAKMQKIRDRNDVRVYKKHNRKKFRRFILALILIAILLFAAVVTAGALIDYGKLPANVAEFIDKYLAYVPPFAPEGAIRVGVKEIIEKVLEFVKGFLG